MKKSLRLAAVLSLIIVLPGARPSQAATPIYAGPIPAIGCDKQSLPEDSIQGRVPKAEVDSGRAAKGYTCNTYEVGHFAATGGFRVARYVDRSGHDCGYFDSTLLFPRDVAKNAVEGLGVFVMDMKDPAHPVHTATLSTPAMLSPHESLRVNQKRGLLAADEGNPATSPGTVDVYDLSKDCLKPTLDSSSLLGVLGHESAFSEDGTVFYASSTTGHTISAIDLTNPKLPKLLWFSASYAAHGMSVSKDGNRLYIADIGRPDTPGLTILDVSGINKHQFNPAVPLVSHITWPEVSIPQNAIPITIKKHKYLVEVDEYTNTTSAPDYANPVNNLYNPTANVGAARLINIDDDKHPYVVSNMRLAVNQKAARGGPQKNDPGALSPVQGYAGHYCSVPTDVDPTYIACSFIVSGLRVFNIQDPKKPYEMAYFNGPIKPGVNIYHSGAFAMSAPAFVPKRNEIWYTDGNSGFYAIRLTAAAFRKGPTKISPVLSTTAGTPIVAPTAQLPHTGLPAALPWAALMLLGIAFVTRRRLS